MSAANRVTAEEVERVLLEHLGDWLGTKKKPNGRCSIAVCKCGWRHENGKMFSATGIHRAHVAAQILALLDSKEAKCS